MSSEVKAVGEVDHAVFIVGVLGELSGKTISQVSRDSTSTYPVAQLLQDIDFDESLLVESFLVPDDLDCHKSTLAVVNTPDNLTKASLSENVDYLVAVCEMVSRHNGVIPSFVVVAKVGLRRVEITHNLAGVLGPTKVDVLAVYNLSTLVNVKHRNPNGFLRAHTFLGSGTLPKSIQCPCCNLGLLTSGTHLSHLLLASQIILIQIGSPGVGVVMVMSHGSG